MVWTVSKIEFNESSGKLAILSRTQGKQKKSNQQMQMYMMSMMSMGSTGMDKVEFKLSTDSGFRICGSHGVKHRLSHSYRSSKWEESSTNGFVPKNNIDISHSRAVWSKIKKYISFNVKIILTLSSETEGGISFENRSLKAERLCTEDGKSYEEGDSFPSPYDDCNECSCDCYDYEGWATHSFSSLSSWIESLKEFSIQLDRERKEWGGARVNPVG